jgi:hypothetical protein
MKIFCLFALAAASFLAWGVEPPESKKERDNRRLQELIKQSEDLRQIELEWERKWFPEKNGDTTKKLADEKGNAELKWTRVIALDFFAVAGGSRAEAEGLLSPEFFKALSEPRFRDFFDELNKHDWNDPKITTEEMALNGNEVILKGTLKRTDYDIERNEDNTVRSRREKTLEADFTLRIVRESADGVWRIRYVRIKEREE